MHWVVLTSQFYAQRKVIMTEPTQNKPSHSPPPHPDPARDPRQQELNKKLPDQVDPAAERGERIEAGKAVATGGKSAAQADTQ